MTQLSTRTDSIEGWAVVRIRGEVDLATASGLERTITDAFAARPLGVVADMALVTFCGSAGVGVLVGAQHRALLTETPLVVVAPSAGPVARSLALTGLDGVVSTAETLDQAMGGPQRAT
ncbi:STAS domain-containing protein [Actinokineospora sp. 24-640]